MRVASPDADRLLNAPVATLEGRTELARKEPRRRRFQPPKKKITLVLPLQVHEELIDLTELLGRNLADTIRWSLSLASFLAREFRSGNRVVVLSPDGTFQKEILYPR